MKNLLPITFGIALILITAGCSGQPGGQAAWTPTESAPSVGQSGVKDRYSKPNVVQVAVGSPDHTTLVADLQAASYVDVLSNVGLFTVFDPTNAASYLLPAFTMENLVKPVNQRKLRNILEYQVLLGVYKPEDFVKGRILGTADVQNVKVDLKEDGIVTINGSKILGTLSASNGIIPVIDQVLWRELAGMRLCCIAANSQT